jgi:hypothetical protein
MYCFAALAVAMGILNGAAGNFFGVIIAGFRYGGLKILYQLPMGLSSSQPLPREEFSPLMYQIYFV